MSAEYRAGAKITLVLVGLLLVVLALVAAGHQQTYSGSLGGTAKCGSVFDGRSGDSLGDADWASPPGVNQADSFQTFCDNQRSSDGGKARALGVIGGILLIIAAKMQWDYKRREGLTEGFHGDWQRRTTLKTVQPTSKQIERELEALQAKQARETVERWLDQAETKPPAPRERKARNVEPGWYDDPYEHHETRYWDGNRWTAHVRDGERPGLDEPPD